VNSRPEKAVPPIGSTGCRFIVNADDFGLSAAVNEGILQAFRQGILTSASLMPTGDAFPQAVRMIKENPALDVGIHLTLVEEKSVLAQRQIPSLVDENGRFRRSAYLFFSDYLRNRISMEEVSKELCAQFEKVISHGVAVSHIDSHQHIHMLPGILEITVRLADRYGIRFIRCPKERICFRNIISYGKYTRLLQQIILNIFCMYSKKQIRPYAVDHFYGFFNGGHLDKSKLVKIFEKHKFGTTEIMCHPARITHGKTIVKYSHWNYEWNAELKGLTDFDIKKMIREKRIILSSFEGKKKSMEV
jgi:chitin disaccharide deacetylase